MLYTVGPSIVKLESEIDMLGLLDVSINKWETVCWIDSSIVAD